MAIEYPKKEKESYAFTPAAFRNTIVMLLKRTDSFIKTYQSVFLVLVFILALVALCFSFSRKIESVWIEEGFIEVCQSQYNKDSLDKNCVKKILKLREVREAPDISKHLENVEKRLKTQVKSDTEHFVNKKVTEGIADIKQDNNENFGGWKSEMDEKVREEKYLRAIAGHVPKPEKQFNLDEENKLRQWSTSIPRYKGLLDGSQNALNAMNQLKINEDILREVKVLSEDSKELRVDNKSGFRAKIESFEDENGPFMKPLNSVKNQQTELSKALETLTNKYYDIRATQDVGGGKESIYMGLVALAVISVTSLLLSLFYKGPNGEKRHYQPVFQPDMSHERGHRQPVYSLESARTGGVLGGVQRKRCDNLICIVSFYKETQRLHQRVINSALSGTRFERVPVESVIINKHEQIKDIPGAKVYCVFVDYNQRHVILENPDLGLGDLRLTTVKGCRKIGGEVAVLYIGDEGSRRLSSGQLFNSSLTSVFQHEELRALNDQQRFFSAHQNLTQDQIHFLQQFFMEKLG